MEFRLVLAGDPVAHSLSPVMHRTAFESTGTDGEYTSIRADDEVLKRLVHELRQGSLQGLNVTMPLKESAARLADALSDEAEKAGSVNSLRFGDGVVEGHSTDVVAFDRLFTVGPNGPTLLVLGSGGAARAAFAAWTGDEALISVRTGTLPAWAARLGARLIPWGEAVPGVLLVNATPLGMAGETVPKPVLDAAARLIDLPYGRRPTPAVVAALGRGMTVVDGIEFLSLQAAAAFEWFTGVPVDSEPLAQAARNV